MELLFGRAADLNIITTVVTPLMSLTQFCDAVDNCVFLVSCERLLPWSILLGLRSRQTLVTVQRRRRLRRGRRRPSFFPRIN